MNSLSRLTTIVHDELTSMSLAVDGSDPPRYYLLDQRQRKELLVISDILSARQLFLGRVAIRKQQRRLCCSQLSDLAIQ